VYPSYPLLFERVREDLRRKLKEILMAIAFVLGAILAANPVIVSNGPVSVLLALVMFALPGGLLLWIAYRVLRFALAR
jgi:hypothetical protein